MRVVRVECWIESLRLTEPYTIAYSTTEAADNVFLRLVTDDGRTGHGATNPDPDVTGETAASTLAALRALEPSLAGCDDGHIMELVERGDLAPSVRACLDMAFFDLKGQSAGRPLHALLGAAARTLVTHVTIGILPVEETLARARHWIASGFTKLKVKGGRDVDLDVARVAALRAELGPGVEIGWDANQGYGLEEARCFLVHASASITFLEQPTPHDRPDLLGILQRETSVPLIADESVTGAKDLDRLIALGPPAAINIKLVKVGGIGRALALEARARAAGLTTMIGCMDESSVGISAALQAALAFPSLRFVDLDGHVFLEDDPCEPRLGWKAGRLAAPPGPGLGLTVRRRA